MLILSKLMDLKLFGDVLGVTTLVGAIVAQVPQIISILKSRNVEGISFTAFSIETYS